MALLSLSHLSLADNVSARRLAQCQFGQTQTCVCTPYRVRSDKVFLRADGRLPYERVAQVMGALNAGGFNNIGLVTDSQGPDFGNGG